MRLAGRVKRYSARVIVVELASPAAALDQRLRKYGNVCEITMLDKRQITPEQRGKLYATFKDIADWSGYSAADVKTLMKGNFLDAAAEDHGYSWFSLADCSVELAWLFQDWLIDFCF